MLWEHNKEGFTSKQLGIHHGESTAIYKKRVNIWLSSISDGSKLVVLNINEKEDLCDIYSPLWSMLCKSHGKDSPVNNQEFIMVTWQILAEESEYLIN